MRTHPFRPLAVRLLALATALLPASAFALERMTIASTDPAADMAALERLGFDVLHGSASAVTFDVVGSDADRAQLGDMGFQVTAREEGRPFADIQRADAARSGVPAVYPSLSDIDASMRALETAHPAICQWVDVTARYGLPPTVDGNHLYAMKISDNVSLEEKEPATLVVSTHHAREIVTPVIAIHAIDRLVNGYGTDPALTALVDENEIWIAPVWNPDGYVYVFEVDNFWRKNRRSVAGGTGIDLNRNYPFGWAGPCPGSSSPPSATYRGPSPASEVETQTLMALSRDQHFGKVLDFHSSGREVVWGFGCMSHPLDAYWEEQAWMLAHAVGYQGDHRPAIAGGEQFQWQLVDMGALAFLIETHVQFQPAFSSAVLEAERVWPGIRWMLEQNPLAWGTVTDAATGYPLEVTIRHVSNPALLGVAYASNGDAGSYYGWLPHIPLTLEFSADGYETRTLTLDPEAGTERRDVALERVLVAAPTAAVSSGTRLLPTPFDVRGVRYAVAAPTPLRIDVFDVRGALVRTLVDAPHDPGLFDVPWSGTDGAGRNVAPGIYYVRLRTPSLDDTQKRVLLD